MKGLIQRVKHATVDINDTRVAEIGKGLLILLGVETGDDMKDVEWLANKCANMRIFNDENGIMNLSVKDVSGDVIVVSQFTLAASVKKGNRPSYIKAAGHETAIPLYEAFCEEIEKLIGKTIGRGRFGADMQVGLINDGPVTIMADSKI